MPIPVRKQDIIKLFTEKKDIGIYFRPDKQI